MSFICQVRTFEPKEVLHINIAILRELTMFTFLAIEEIWHVCYKVLGRVCPRRLFIARATIACSGTSDSTAPAEKRSEEFVGTSRSNLEANA